MQKQCVTIYQEFNVIKRGQEFKEGLKAALPKFERIYGPIRITHYCYEPYGWAAYGYNEYSLYEFVLWNGRYRIMGKTNDNVKRDWNAIINKMKEETFYFVR